MVRMQCTRAMTYNTRRLVAGDVFEVRPRDVRVLLAIGKARAMRAEATVPAPPPAVADAIPAFLVRERIATAQG